MDFPILNLIDDELAVHWLLNHFHPQGLKCPHCGAGVKAARPCRRTTTSQLTVYRCLVCQGIYNLYNSTSARGCRVQSSRVKLVSVARQCFQYDARFKPMPKRCNPTSLLQIDRLRLTRCSKTLGKKSEPHHNPLDPPRRRANKRKGDGTYAKDRPPVVGTVGRESGQVRLGGVHQFTQVSAKFTPMSGKATWVSTARMLPFATASEKGQEMPRQMGFEKATPIRSKVSGQWFATSCVLLWGSQEVPCRLYRNL
jgi:hypothetical protein